MWEVRGTASSSSGEEITCCLLMVANVDLREGLLDMVVYGQNPIYITLECSYTQ